jgi:hypothetical protein
MKPAGSRFCDDFETSISGEISKKEMLNALWTVPCPEYPSMGCGNLYLHVDLAHIYLMIKLKIHFIE